MLPKTNRRPDYVLAHFVPARMTGYLSAAGTGRTLRKGGPKIVHEATHSSSLLGAIVEYCDACSLHYAAQFLISKDTRLILCVATVGYNNSLDTVWHTIYKS